MANMPQSLLKKHIPHSVIVKAPGLLPMLYTPSELEDELGIPSRTIRDWINSGAPHQRDNRGHIWVNGVEFAQWVEIMRKSKPSQVKMGNDEAYCLRCRKPVKLLNSQQKQRGKHILLTGDCPECGCTINRGGYNGES